MDSRDRFPDHDPPATAALYLSALSHDHHYSAAELRQAVSRAHVAFGGPAELPELYRQSMQGADNSEHDVRVRRRSWALRMARHLALDDGRPAAAAPEWAARPKPVTAASEFPPRMPAPFPSPYASHQADIESFGLRQTTALRELRAARRRPAQVAAAVVAAQMAGVILANEAPGVMASVWAGPLNIGLTLVLVQVAFTGWAVLWYSRYAARSLEPLVKRHRASFPHLESDR
ncbi:DUF485 domain-containing protein [Streptomyces sp. AC555_RSS877]|uniref:DUF485 domain-containing protein n=1 Tax=Streptomyces sp. AC555_RSS877 TaxID=2823688 RepID=UPI001C275FE6|nr:DUF485 domain-containing protein [Streptomyces sp. AC555_RSS877]